MKSLERRFVVGLALTLLPVFGILLWASATAVRSLSEAYVLTRLEHDAEALVAAFDRNPRGHLRLREGRISPIYQQPLSGHYYVLHMDGAPPLRSRSLWDENLPPTGAFEPGQVRIGRLPGPGNQQLLVRQAGYEKAGKRFSLLVAEDLTPLTQQIRNFQIGVLALVGLSLLSIIAAQRYLLRRGFRALDDVRNDMHKVASGELQQVAELGPDEVRPLTGEINRLLRQLQQRLRRSRRSLGNLAHALKAPLSLLVHDIEALPIDRHQRSKLSGHLTRIDRLVSRELKRARIAGDGVGQHFNPAAHIPPLIDGIRQLYRHREIQTTTGTLPGQMLPLDYEDMLEMLGNLLDNAFKWAKTEVHLLVEIDNSICIRVADDGPGVAEEMRTTLLRRGSRLDEHEAGHGLGLAIVRDLIEDYGGDLALDRSTRLGGLEVTIALPLPASEH